MKVLHVISGLDPKSGGPAAAISGLCCALLRASVDVTVASTFSQGFDDQLVRKIQSVGVHVELIGPATGPLLRHSSLPKRVCELAAEHDVIHIHALWEEIHHHAARVAANRGIPFVISPHGMLDQWSMRKSGFAKRLYLALRMRRHLNRAAAIHHITEWEHQQARHLNISTPRVILPIGLELDEFTHLPPRGYLRDRHAIGDRPLIVFLGRVHPGKGVEYLIPALSQLRIRDACLAIVGPDADGFSDQMRSLAMRLAISERVFFTGMARGADRIAALVDADVFALPSDHENFSIATAEAMAAGKPVVLSDQVGLGPLVLSHQVGSSVPINTPSIATALDHWLTNPELAAEAGQRARQLAMREFDWSTIARNWCNAYAGLIHRR